MLILASKSAGRLSTLRGAGIEPLVRVSDVDEAAVLSYLAADHARHGRGAPGPIAQVRALARAKARAVARLLRREDPDDAAPPPPAVNAGPSATGDLVVGCDSMLEIDGQVVGKPRSPQAARDRWRSMRGRSGRLHSGHCVIRLKDGRCAQAVSSTVVHFGTPSLEEIDAYVATGEPLWCAGAFTIDGLGGAFIDGVEGDPHGVVGLSLPLLRRLVGELEVTWTDLWTVPSERSDGAEDAGGCESGA